MGFIFFRGKHCTLTAMIEFFLFAMIGISIYITLALNAQFGQNLLVLFGISALSGGIGLVLYKIAHKRK